MPCKSKEIESSDSPLEVFAEGGLNFKCEGMAPLLTPLEQVIWICNKTEKPYYCAFPASVEDRKSFTCTPSETCIFLAPDERKSISFTLTIYCTVDLMLKLPIFMWEKGAKECVFYYLESCLYSDISLHLYEGDVICNKVLGEGSFGIVFEGEYRGAPVAVKKIKIPDRVPRELIVKDFDKEADILARLRHPAITLFIGSVKTDTCLSLVTELSPYGSLQSVIEKLPTISLTFRIKALYDIATAMNFLHMSHIIHRDLKAENCLVFSLDANIFPITRSPIVKLADFGTSKPLGYLAAMGMMAKTMGVGSPLFMAPEMLLNKEDYTSSVDVYSFSSMMSHVLNGRICFDGGVIIRSESDLIQNLRKGIRPVIPSFVSANIRKLMQLCWNWDPSLRPDFSAIVNVLDAELNALQSQFTHY